MIARDKRSDNNDTATQPYTVAAKSCKMVTSNSQ